VNLKSCSYISNVRLEAVQIDEGVDTRTRKSIHAPGMIGGLVDVVDSDSICSELFHQIGITLALSSLDKRIVFDELVGDACHKLMSVSCNLEGR
jgi:hypothetical protein